MTRTEMQELVRDAAWRLNVAAKRERLTGLDLGILGMAISNLLGWGPSATKRSKDRAARVISDIIAKMDG